MEEIQGLFPDLRLRKEIGALCDLIAISVFATFIWAITVRLDRRSILWVFTLSGILSLEIYDVAVLCSQTPPYRMLAGLFAAIALVALGLRELRRATCLCVRLLK